MTRYWAEYAWLGGETGGTTAQVLLTIEQGYFVEVTTGVAAPSDAIRLPGLTLPGMANAHSHAFHRALRGRTHSGRGTFWTWRQRMYEVAGWLDPDSYHALARATFAEMALAGITCVGEFHYLHHGPDGVSYHDPNEMGHRLIAAAAEAGIRITLLDTLYLSSTAAGEPLVGPQRRFGDGDVDTWWERVGQIASAPHARIGAAAHSIRAVPAESLARLAQHIQGRPTHVHLSEQRAENEMCLALHGLTPTQLLDRCGLTGPEVTAVHATHVTADDRRLLGDAHSTVCFCPTTERDLADGIGPARALTNAGSALALGSDSHAMIDLLEEARAVELNERLRAEQRGGFTVDELLTAATLTGHTALGWPDAGTIAVGQRADLVTVRLDSVRTAGFAPTEAAAAVLFGAGAADISQVVIDGRVIVQDGHHALVGDVAGALADSVTAIWP